jgi:hypothetical protein
MFIVEPFSCIEKLCAEGKEKNAQKHALPSRHGAVQGIPVSHTSTARAPFLCSRINKHRKKKNKRRRQAIATLTLCLLSYMDGSPWH